MRIGITGSREFPSRAVVENWVASLPPDTIIRHGNARGVDRWVDEAAKKRGLVTEPREANWSDLSHPDAYVKTRPDGSKYDARAGLRRNGEITAADDVDKVTGFWDGHSSGTADALHKAKAAGKAPTWFDAKGVERSW